MTGHRNFDELRDRLLEHPGAAEQIAASRAEAEEEIRLYELRRGEVARALSTGRLDIDSRELPDGADLRMSTLRHHLDALGARLELVAVFDDDHRVSVHIGP